MKEILGTTKIVGLIGDPVEHSISPQIHNAAFDKLNLNYRYAAFRVYPKNLGKAVEALKALGISGFNVTIPHKENILKFLDKIDDSAKLIGAANTVKITDGKLTGYNTDSKGFIDSLVLDSKINPSNKKVFLIGAGGGAKAIAASLCSNKISELIITDINKPKALGLKNHLKKYFNTKISVIFEKDEIDFNSKNCNILINATPIGMFPRINALPIELDKTFNKNIFVYDIVYIPNETKLLKNAGKLNLKNANGLQMLVRQAAAAFYIFTGHAAPAETMKKAAIKALKLS